MRARHIRTGLAVSTALACLTMVSARAQAPSWLDPTLLAAAKTEGALVVYSAINEEEGLPFWKIFEGATGLKVQYVRASDVQVLARIMIEARTGTYTWDVLQTPGVHKLPQELLAVFDPPEARHVLREAHDPNRRWIGVTAIYQAPAYNTR